MGKPSAASRRDKLLPNGCSGGGLSYLKKDRGIQKKKAPAAQKGAITGDTDGSATKWNEGKQRDEHKEKSMWKS